MEPNVRDPLADGSKPTERYVMVCDVCGRIFDSDTKSWIEWMANDHRNLFDGWHVVTVIDEGAPWME